MNKNLSVFNFEGTAKIFGLKLESSKRFKKWVTSEVLPAIRKLSHKKTENQLGE